MTRFRSRHHRLLRQVLFWVGNVAIVLGCGGLFIGGVYWFRSRAPAKQDISTLQVAPLLPAVPPVPLPTLDPALPWKREFEFANADGTMRLLLTRDRMTGSEWKVVLNAQLPAIDPATTAYELWFVRKYPYDFYSLGRPTVLADGTFRLEWVGKHVETEAMFTQLVLTQQVVGGDTNPGVHVFEAEFE